MPGGIAHDFLGILYKYRMTELNDVYRTMYIEIAENFKLTLKQIRLVTYSIFTSPCRRTDGCVGDKELLVAGWLRICQQPPQESVTFVCLESVQLNEQEKFQSNLSHDKTLVSNQLQYFIDALVQRSL